MDQEHVARSTASVSGGGGGVCMVHGVGVSVCGVIMKRKRRLLCVGTD